jgi:hypothetical protein
MPSSAPLPSCRRRARRRKAVRVTKPAVDPERQFLEPWVGQVVIGEGRIIYHYYAETPRGLIPFLNLVDVLVTLPGGIRHDLTHVHVNYSHALRPYRPKTRVRFKATVREYHKRGGARSYNLSHPFEPEVVAPPIALRVGVKDQMPGGNPASGKIERLQHQHGENHNDR